MRRIISLILFCLILNDLASAHDKPYQIGLVSDLSGPFQIAGDECRFGYELALQEAFPDITRQVEYIYEDSQSTSIAATTVYKKLAQDTRTLAVSIFGSQASMTVNPLSLREKLPTVGFAGAINFTRDNPYAFASWID